MLKKGGTYICWRCGLEIKCMKDGCNSTSVMCCGEPIKLKFEQRNTSMKNKK